MSEELEIVEAYSREEVDADVRAALASSLPLDSTARNTAERSQRISKFKSEIQATSPDLMGSYHLETAECEVVELAVRRGASKRNGWSTTAGNADKMIVVSL